MSGLDQDDRALLAEYKASIGPEPRDVEDNWEQIVERLDAPTPAPSGHSRLLWFGFGAAAAMLTVVLGMQLVQGQRGRDAAAFQSVDRVQPSVPSAAPVRAPDVQEEVARVRNPVVPAADEPQVVVPVPEADPVVDDDPEPPRPRRSRPSKRTTHPAQPPTEPEPVSPALGAHIKAELALLRKVRAALAASDYGLVSSLVRRYRRDFADGTMAEEVHLLGVHALCAAGPKEAWATARARFEGAYPKSPLRAQLRDDCFP